MIFYVTTENDMAQSTEDYLDSLLRQAMGIPDPEPEVKEEQVPDLEREDVLAMAEGLSGSNSAILGNVYDHNASFTNEGEIEIPAAPPVAAAPDSAAEPVAPIAPEDMPDPDAPVAIGSAAPSENPVPVEMPVPEETPIITESLLPDIDIAAAPETETIGEPAAEIPPVAEPVDIPDSPVIEPSDNLDILSDDVMEGLVEPSIEGHPLESPIVEEPVIEEPIVEEPAIEEPVIEEPIIEEPAAEEAAPAPADVEEPVTEEPIIEEPIIEEPAIEEPIAEEPELLGLEAEAEPEPEAEAEPEAEPEPEPEAEAEPESELIGLDAEPEPELEAAKEDEGLEELSIPEESDAESPLMPDQEISDLLSSLGELTGENTPEEEETTETAEEAADEAEDTSDEATGEAEATATGSAEESALDGIDMFDTDLSAMLDDALSAVDGPVEGDAPVSEEDADLNDLLGSLDDGSGDLSDIGDLLEKDENSELVDPNTETAEALFASDSEEDLFDIDNVIDDEEGGKGKKKKKKKGLFGKKKKGSENVETIGGDEEMLIDPDLLDIPDESELPKKKGGFFANLFAKLFEEVGEDEGGENELIGLEQTAVEIAQEGAEENEAILAEIAEEEGGKDKKKGKKEKKKKEKKEKKGKKADAGEGDEGEEGAEEPKKKKKEKKKKEKLPELPSKKLPRKKVVAIALFCITIGIVITFLAFMYPYSQDMKKAKKFYSTGEYQKTYEYMRGHKLTSDDQILYNKTTTLLRIKRPYDSYQNYMKMGLRMEALNALVQGIQMSDKYAQEAASLGITDKYSLLSRKIYDELYNTFGVTVERARSWIELEGSPEYTKALYECLIDTSGARNSQDDYQDNSLFEENEDPVINAEENDL